MEALNSLTFEDIIRSGACEEGVVNACATAGVFACSAETAIRLFPENAARILLAANLDGKGDGYGDGKGYGKGYGYGGL